MENNCEYCHFYEEHTGWCRKLNGWPEDTEACPEMRLATNMELIINNYAKIKRDGI